MTILLLISLYVLHVFICRALYIKIVNTDKDAECPIIAITWFVPGGILIHLLMLSIVSKTPSDGNWFIPKSKQK